VPPPRELRLGGDAQCYLHFQYLAWPLFQLQARDDLNSPNLVARLNLPNMAYAPEDKLAVYAQAVRGLLTLEPDPERRVKYLDFIDIYAQLDDHERQLYQQQYAQEADIMSGFAERFIQQGLQQGEARVLLLQLSTRFGELPPTTRQRIETADAETLLHWSERVLTARSLEEVLH